MAAEQERREDERLRAQEEADLALALQLSAADAEMRAANEAVPFLNDDVVDPEWIKAMELQAQLELEEAKRVYGWEDGDGDEPNHDLDDDDDADELEDDDAYWENLGYGLVGQRDRSLIGASGHEASSPSRMRGGLAIDADTGELVSKHDAKLASSRHRRAISELYNGDMGQVGSVGMDNVVFSSLREHARRKNLRGVSRGGGEADERAVVEQVMDKPTRLLLFGLLNSGTLDELHGVVATGKESNVYHAVGGRPGGQDATTDADAQDAVELAVKIFKLDLSSFQRRQKYMEGEHRFRRRLQAKPRKLVRLWAEKELRNLRRLRRHGVSAPRPLMLREHVLIMEFLGENGQAAPRLRDAPRMSHERLRDCFRQVARIMRQMYQRCSLVHADLSEFNLLLLRGRIYVIDVSQSVEHDHVNALQFLRKDCRNVRNFFASRGLKEVLSPQTLFKFVTTKNLHGGAAEEDGDDGATADDDELEADNSWLNDAMAARVDGGSAAAAADSVAEAVFLNAYVPHTLADVPNPLRETENLRAGKVDPDVFHHSVNQIG